ncbi:MAG: hypothetical protein C4336_02515 [Armatimonadota bacterium]
MGAFLQSGSAGQKLLDWCVHTREKESQARFVSDRFANPRKIAGISVLTQNIGFKEGEDS